MKSSTSPSQSSAEADQAFRKKALKVSSKITLLSFSMVLLTALVLTAIVFVQKGRLSPVLGAYLDGLAWSEAEQTLRTIRDMCVSTQEQSRRELDHSLSVAREMLQQKGAVAFDKETVTWEVEAQGSQSKTQIELPKFLLGGQWIGRNASRSTSSPIVDDTKHFTDAEATIFQRINNAGDMMRVATSVLKADGTRAIGTALTATNGDGSPNPVLAAVLKGETFHGRALVVNEWYEAVYEPLWDSGHQKVVGMLFVGKNMTKATQAVRESILKVTLGKGGYMFVFGTKGDHRSSATGSPSASPGRSRS
ncbi:MAG: Cache 3/Cache 2 fusion domain-containing protein [Verrucomicrobia bacterium]|nr:Cache 3/Cache 2 fusion domain-containing protein [Verrucomicrobiota bacterium]